MITCNDTQLFSMIKLMNAIEAQVPKTFRAKKYDDWQINFDIVDGEVELYVFESTDDHYLDTSFYCHVWEGHVGSAASWSEKSGATKRFGVKGNPKSFYTRLARKILDDVKKVVDHQIKHSH